jgi:hypothetical protein
VPRLSDSSQQDESQNGEPRASSRGSWAANPFVGDSGPRFDPEAAAGPTPLHVLDVAWQPDRIRTALRAQGVATHELVGVGQEDWLWRASELEAISEPAANVLNKFPVTRAAAVVSDELAVAGVLGEYVLRSYRERLTVLRSRARARKAAEAAQQGPRPVTGYDAAGTKVSPGEVHWMTPDE